jgi:hypothetical protein
MPRDFLCPTELVEGDPPPVGESGRRLHGVAAHNHAHLHLKVENKISPCLGDPDYSPVTSVSDPGPEPYVFGSPGSGSFHLQAK